MSQINQEELLNYFLDKDETSIVKFIELLSQERQKKGYGKDIIESLNKNGIKVLTSPLEKPFYKSKKFWGGMIALIIILLDMKWKGIWYAAIGPLTYIFGQGLADMGKNRAA